MNYNNDFQVTESCNSRVHGRVSGIRWHVEFRVAPGIFLWRAWSSRTEAQGVQRVLEDRRRNQFHNIHQNSPRDGLSYLESKSFLGNGCFSFLLVLVEQGLITLPPNNPPFPRQVTQTPLFLKCTRRRHWRFGVTFRSNSSMQYVTILYNVSRHIVYT